MGKGNPTAGILLLLIASLIIAYGLPAMSNYLATTPDSIIKKYMEENGLDDPGDPSQNRSGGSADEVPKTLVPPGTVPKDAQLDLGFVGERGANSVG